MEQKILQKDQVGKLYSELSKVYTFYAPIKEKGNIVINKHLAFFHFDCPQARRAEIQKFPQNQYCFLRWRFFLNTNLMEKM